MINVAGGPELGARPLGGRSRHRPPGSPGFRPPGSGPSSSTAATCSRCRPRKGAGATSPAVPASPIGTRSGRPTETQIAWFNDEGGEYGLVVADQDGGNPRRIAIADPTFYFVPTWSPDGTRLAFTDTDYRVLILDLASGEVTHVDTDRFAHPERSMNPVWSPDSRWIAYAGAWTTSSAPSSCTTPTPARPHQLTDGMADAISPVWDASGKYLYFLASTDYGLNTGWLDMTSYDRPVTRALYVALLKADEPSPFLPKSDEERSGGRGQASAGKGSQGRG